MCVKGVHPAYGRVRLSTSLEGGRVAPGTRPPLVSQSIFQLYEDTPCRG